MISFFGILFNFKNILILLMGIEVLLLSLNLNFIYFSLYLDDIIGLLMAIFILTIAASESAIGLAIIILYYRLRGYISTTQPSTLRD
jgi:NADH-quinone oxidoreductase subunit K